MALDPNDPRPQIVTETVGGTLRTEPRGPYVDQALTKRNLQGQVSTAVNPLDEKNRGEVKVYRPAGWQGSGFTTKTPLPNSPNSWRVGRDPYAIDGMVGQDFTKNNFPRT